MKYALTLLGTVDLRAADGRRVVSVLSQPKRLALLTILALESPRRLQRDELIGRLWPDMSQERARGALRQSLYYLRRSLGPGIVTGKGAEGIGVAEEKLECDARELLRAAGEGRWAEALDRYGGELMPAFHLDDTPAPFEHWLTEARRRVHRAASDAAWRQAETAAAAGDPAAAEAARRGWELDGWTESGLQRVVETHLRLGDAAGARAAYEEHVARLADGESPSDTSRALLEAIERAASTTRRDIDPAVGPAAGSRTAPIRTRWWLAAAVVAAALVVLGALRLSNPTGPGAATGEWSDGAWTLHLEPVRDLSADRPDSQRAEWITAELAAQLAETGAHEVALDSEDPRDGFRLRPTLTESDSLLLSVLILDPVSDAVLQRLTVGADPTRPPDDLATRMAHRVRQAVGDLVEWRGLAAERIRPPALDAVRTAAEEAESATALRRRGAREAATVAYAAADSLLAHAEKLSPGWVEPTARRAELTLSTAWLHLVPPHDDPVLAHRELRRGLRHAEKAVAIEDGPRAYAVRGVVNYWAGLTAASPADKSRFESAAERDLERAVRLDPDHPRAWDILSALAERRGDYAVAYQRARKAYSTDHALRTPTDILARLFLNALEVGDAEGAARWCREARDQRPEHWIGPYCDLARLAWVGPWSPAASHTLLREGLAHVPDHPGGRLTANRLELLHAIVLARAGQQQAAREILRSVDASEGDLGVLDLMAWARLALGEPDRARDLLADATERNPGRARQILRSRRYAELPPYTVVRSDP